jgi:hypothetical protein
MKPISTGSRARSIGIPSSTITERNCRAISTTRNTFQFRTRESSISASLWSWISLASSYPTTTTKFATSSAEEAFTGPSSASWDRLNRDVGGRLIEVRSPFGVCRGDPVGLACDDLFTGLKNPYYIGDDVALTQTTGWVDAWTAQPSIFAVAAETTGDIVAAVKFARDNNLRLVGSPLAA